MIPLQCPTCGKLLKQVDEGIWGCPEGHVWTDEELTDEEER